MGPLGPDGDLVEGGLVAEGRRARQRLVVFGVGHQACETPVNDRVAEKAFPGDATGRLQAGRRHYDLVTTLEKRHLGRVVRDGAKRVLIVFGASHGEEGPVTAGALRGPRTTLEPVVEDVEGRGGGGGGEG